MSTALLASPIVAAVGGLLLWANPRRKVNRAVFGSSATVAAWLISGHFASSQPEHGLFWLRFTHAIGGLAPLSLWIVKEGIIGTFRLRNIAWFRGNIVWFLSATFFFLLPFSETFIPSHSSQTQRIRGLGYYLYYVGLVFLYGRLLYESVLSLKALSGARKLELQVWLLGGCSVASVIYLLIGLGALTGSSVYRSLQPIAVLVFYAGTAYAITSYRIFDARQIVLVGIEKMILLFVSTVSAFLVNQAIGIVLSELLSFIVTASVVLFTASVMHGWLDDKFQFLPKGGAARQAAFAIAQRETGVDKLEDAFRSLLKGWGQTEQAIILSGTKRLLIGSGVQLDGSEAFVSAMKALRWATPERLSRERATVQRQAIAAFLEEHDLGVLAIEEGPALTVVLGVSVGASRRPYTYPEVIQLMELAAIMQAALERAHYSSKAQHAEQLATVGVLGASLAHEIRNPLVSIKTFIQLLPSHYGDPKFREKFFRLISDEVARIDQLTEQLLDLASPRTYIAQEISLHALLVASIDLVASRASHRQVHFITDFKAFPDKAFTDASAAKQVMINLCFNAIQAVESCNRAERWVKIATRNVSVGIEMSVADSGPGIAPEIRPRLFQPFQTTKSTGFGLGLAICNDILTNLAATISVDPSEPGQGATFRVTFPCRPLSS